MSMCAHGSRLSLVTRQNLAMQAVPTVMEYARQLAFFGLLQVFRKFLPSLTGHISKHINDTDC